ncbi:MAG: hypothetical protein PQJ60_14420 [Spirochaetales bacterium]|nr:hypothetical protein [Spirochaetales bacterium]
MDNLPYLIKQRSYKKHPLKGDRKIRKIIKGLHINDCLIFYYNDELQDLIFTGCFRVKKDWYLINYDLGNPVKIKKSENRKDISRELLSYRRKKEPVTICGYIWAPETIRKELVKTFDSLEKKASEKAIKNKKSLKKTPLGRFSDYLTKFKLSLILISILSGIALVLILFIMLLGILTSTFDDVLNFMADYHLGYLTLLIIFPILLLIQNWIKRLCPYCNSPLNIKQDLVKYYMNTGGKVFMRKTTCPNCGYKLKEQTRKGLILEPGETPPKPINTDFTL